MPSGAWGAITLFLLGVGLPVLGLPPIVGVLFVSAAAVTGGLTIRAFLDEQPSILKLPPRQALASLVVEADSRREPLKDLLGERLHAGGELMKRDPTTQEAREWVTRSHALISAALGPAEAARFESHAGYTFWGGTRAYNWVNGGTRRLNELIARVDSLPIRDGFHPDDWRD